MKKSAITLLSTIVMIICGSTVIAAPTKTCPANGKLKIFILSGQSNMVGFGQLKGETGTMEAYLKSNPKDYGHLVDADGKHVVRDDVWIVNLSYKDKERQGWLTTGYGASPDHIGPEYGFGFVVGNYFEDPVLLIKSAWGGRSLSKNFLSPSSADYPAPKADGDTGFQYAEVLRHVKEITGNLKKYYPSYSGKGYEIVGFGWHQGWNDRINQDAVDAYEKNMEHFIKDTRKDLRIEKLPFVIANTGMGGWDIPPTARYKKRVEKLMDAQLALADPEKYPAFKGNVSGVETRDFQRTLEESPSRQGYHWNRNWETFYLIGKGMGDSTVSEADRPDTVYSGTVTDVDDNAIEGAKLHLLSYSRFNTVSGQQGEYEISWDPSKMPGSYRDIYIIARHEEKNLASATRFGPETHTRNITLLPAVTATGTITDTDGKAIGNGTVSFGFTAAKGYIASFADHKRFAADSRGIWKVPFIPPENRYLVRFHSEGYGSKEISVNTDDAVDGVLELGSAALSKADQVVSGVVVGPDGKPVANVQVFRKSRGQPVGYEETDDEGRFTLNVCKGNVSLSAVITMDGTFLAGRAKVASGTKDVRIVLEPR